VSLWRLSAAPVTSDEPVYAAAGWGYLHAKWGQASGGNFEHPPLAKLLFGVAQLVAGHPSITAARAIGAVSTLLTALVLAAWLTRARNLRTGLIAAGLYTLIPTSLMPQLTGLGRTAMLDPVAELFMVTSVALTWLWFTTTGRTSWRWAIITGIAVGLAAASKENGFLGAVGPVALGICTARRSESHRTRQAAVAAAAALTTFAATYLPLGNPLALIDYLIRFQLGQRNNGHLVGYAGRVDEHPRWWANLWFAWHSLGAPVALALIAATTAAVVLRRDRLTAWCLAALAAPVLFHCFLAGNTLPFYWAMWMPALYALAALGTDELLTRIRRTSSPRYCLPAVALLGLCAAPVTTAAVVNTARVANLSPVGGAVLAAIRHDYSLTGSVLTTGLPTAELQPYLPNTVILSSLPDDLRYVGMVVIGQPRCRQPSDPAVRALLAANEHSGVLHRICSDRLITVYVATSPLARPTSSEIASQPASQASDHC